MFDALPASTDEEIAEILDQIHARVTRLSIQNLLDLDRLTESTQGQLLYQLPHPRRDGATHLLLDPLELIEKLCVLIARAGPREPGSAERAPAASGAGRRSWAALMKRDVVFQGPALFPWYTVRDNLAFGPRTRGLRAAQYEPKGRAYLEQVGLTGFESHYPAELSGGMKQRVALPSTCRGRAPWR